MQFFRCIKVDSETQAFIKQINRDSTINVREKVMDTPTLDDLLKQDLFVQDSLEFDQDFDLHNLSDSTVMLPSFGLDSFDHVFKEQTHMLSPEARVI